MQECVHVMYLFQLSLSGNPLFEGAATGTEEIVIEHSKGGDGIVVRGIESARWILG